MRKAFTLMELVVALAILALVLSFAGAIFRVSLESQQLARANAEIMQKLRVLTDQLDADFRGLLKDGEIFVVWSARHKRKLDYPTIDPNDRRSVAFDRFDRIVFFAGGDFTTFGPDPNRGNVARICYTLARGPTTKASEPNRPQAQKPHKRILARTQHILIPPALADASDTFDTSGFDTDDWVAWNSRRQIDKISLEGWKRIPFAEKANILSVIGDLTVADQDDNPISTTDEEARGVLIDRSEPDSFHSLFCQGVGQFMVQGWNDAENRWIPEVNPDDDDSLADSDFPLNKGGKDVSSDHDPALWYPRGPSSLTKPRFPSTRMDRDHFNEIPGLGRALKFTFTLYDSRNLIKEGRTFTHVVYIDN